MSSINPLNPLLQDTEDINYLTLESFMSAEKVKTKLSSIRGKFATRVKSKQGKMPEWAAKHIQIHQQLEKAINELKGRGEEIPRIAIYTLSQSQDMLRKIANRVNYSAFLRAFVPNPNTIYADPSKLLTPLSDGSAPIHSNMQEWELNFGLLYAAYKRTENPEARFTIRFLMTNYLAKAAYLNASTGVNLSDADTQSYKNMLQLGQFTLGGMYHRNVELSASIIDILELEKKLGSKLEKGKDFIALDTIEVQELYGVNFVTTPDLSKKNQIVTILVEQFERHLNDFPDKNMEFPVLMDITGQIGQSLITDGDPEKIKAYEEKQKAVTNQINKLVRRAATKIKTKYANRPDIQEKAENYIKFNLAVVSRARVNDRLAVIGMHKFLFDETDFQEPHPSKLDQDNDRYNLLSTKLKTWAAYSGIGIGGVSFRLAAAEVKKTPEELSMLEGSGQAVNYTVLGRTDVIMYPKPNDITRSELFAALKEIAEGKNLGEAQTLMADFAVKMMRTLLNIIPDETWTERQKDLVIREMTQNALFRTSQHLAKAIQNVRDFRQFSQAIELIHTELATLLMLYKPFSIRSFEKRYGRILRPIFPGAMKPTAIGIGKSGMNIFAGINAAVMQSHPHPVRILGNHSYYEEALLLGKTQTLKQALADTGVEKVDLYVGEFNHNIVEDPNYIHYRKGNVIADVRKIFRKKPKTDALTIVLDATIDITQSSDIKMLFNEFKEEIKQGRLNIVVFRSGQKFEMMGLDHYFGSLFYVVNNGDEKWNPFKDLKTHAAFQTDELSQQFFSWMVKAGIGLADQYKMQIFKNTKEILKLVPEGLQAARKKEVCVCSFDNDVETPFIDIKLDMKDEDKKIELRLWAQKRFLEIFIAQNKLVYVRGSFGFPHPNITWVDPKLRINPGIDPSEISLYKQFFEELEKKVSEIHGIEDSSETNPDRDF